MTPFLLRTRSLKEQQEVDGTNVLQAAPMSREFDWEQLEMLDEDLKDLLGAEEVEEGGGEGALGAGAEDHDEYSGIIPQLRDSNTEMDSVIQSRSLPGITAVGEQQRPVPDTSRIQESGSCLEKRGRKRGRPRKGDIGVLDPELISGRNSYWRRMGFFGN